MGLSIGEREALKRLLLRKSLAKRRDIYKKSTSYIPVCDREKLIPASRAQRRIWFISSLDPNTSQYNILDIINIESEVSVQKLTYAFEYLIQRHEILRTTFKSDNGILRQIISNKNTSTFNLLFQDITQINEKDSKNAVLEKIGEEVRAKPFDLDQGPLLRATLVKLDEERFVLFFAIHHIISDGWSMDILKREFLTVYESESKDEIEGLPRQEIQYADYAVWEENRISKEKLEKQIAYWKRELEFAEPLINLPLDKQRPRYPSARGNSLAININGDVAGSLKDIDYGKDLTVGSFFLSIFAILMYILSGQLQVVIGIPITNRSHKNTENMLGLFVNTLPIKFDFSKIRSVNEYFIYAKATILAAYNNSDVPFDQIVEAINPTRNTSFSSIFQVDFNFATSSKVPDDDGDTDTAYDQIDIDVGDTAKFDLSLSISEDAIGSINYSTDLFNEETIARWIDYFGKLIDCCLDKAFLNLPINAISVLREGERHQLLVGFNSTQKPFPEDALIHELFEAQAERHPEATALVFNDKKLSYGDLNIRANQVAHALMEQGVTPDSLVGICIERSFEMVIGIIGVLKAGGAYVPLDPQYPAARLAFQIQDAKLRILLTQQSVVDQANLASIMSDADIGDPHLVCLDDPIVQARLETHSASNPDASQLQLHSSHLAYVTYTSGTTGNPKGVMTAHKAVVNFATDLKTLDLGTENLGWAWMANYVFDASVQGLSQLALGQLLVIIPEETKKNPSMLRDFLTEHPVSVMDTTPSLVSMWLDFGLGDVLPNLIIGGEKIEPGDWDRLKAWQEKQGKKAFNVYGPTESCINSVYTPIVSKFSCIGKPLANTEIVIVSPTMSLVPFGVVGELLIGGVGLARGYLNRPELTAEKFIAHPFSEELKKLGVDYASERLYRTGDLVRYLPDGNLEYVGRKDQQVKLRGFRIELSEIETLLQDHEAIKQAVVILKEEQLVAYLVLGEGTVADADALRTHLGTRLPEYMLPHVFMSLDALPLNANGKLDIKALSESNARVLEQTSYEAPLGPMENILAQIWQDLLKVERVGRHDHFFRLGGHSLLIIRLIAILQEKGLQLKVALAFQFPVLKDLAEQLKLSNHRAFEAPPNLIPFKCEQITPEMLTLIELEQRCIDSIAAQSPGGVQNIQDIYPLGPLQEGILFHHMLSTPKGGDNYITPLLFEVANRAGVDQFIRALNKVVSRHDLLRTIVLWEGLPQAVQVVLRHAQIEHSEIHLDPSQDGLSQLQAHIAPGKLWMSFQQAPLLKVIIAADPQSEAYFVVIYQHHIINDHVGLEIVTKEVDAYLDEPTVQLPASIPYRHYVAQALAMEKSEEAKAYFASTFGDMEEPTLPFGLSDTQVLPHQIVEASQAMDVRVSEEIRHRCRELDISPASFFHLVFATLLGRCAGRKDVVFGTVLSGRLQGTAGAAESVGLFINTLPLRVRLNVNLKTALRQVYDNLQTLVSYEHSSINTVRAATRLASEVPMFVALFNYRYQESLLASTVEEAHLGEEYENLDDLEEENTVAIEALEGSYERSNYPLVLNLDDLGTDGFSFNMQSVNSLDPSQLLGYLQTLASSCLEALTEDLQTPVHHLNLLPIAERQQLLVELNRTATAFPENALIHELFEAQVKRTPHATVLVFEDQQLSYRELNQRANQLAHYLVDQGVKPDTLVGLCLERSLNMVVGIFGILKAGGAYVPLDPQCPKTRLAFQVQDAQLRILLSQQSVVDKANLRHVMTEARLRQPHLVCLDDPIVQARLSTYPTHNLSATEMQLSSTHLAYVVYTSGTTGNPKGVMTTHKAVLNFGADLNTLNLDPHNRGWGWMANYVFDASVQGLSQLSLGQRLVLIPEETKKNPVQLRDFLIKHPVSVLDATPTLASSWLDAGLGEVLPHLVIGGEKIDAREWERLTTWQAKYNKKAINVYGPTECCINSTYTLIKGAVPSIGKPLSNTHIVIVNQEMSLVPYGAAGELLIGGVGLARGYLNRPELTAEKFLDNPFKEEQGRAGVKNPSERLYRTGDCVRYLPDGNIEYLGRMDQQVKLRGYRIELGEIEAQLRQHQAIKHAVVILREEQLVAYVVPAEPGPAGLDVDALRRFLENRLPEYMVPRMYVALNALPLNASGKLDRKALPAARESASQQSRYEAPVGPTEMTLAKIWQDLLKVERVGRKDNFFTLGGHSLSAIMLFGQLQQQLNKSPSFNTIFEHPELKALARVLDASALITQVPIAVADRTQALPLSWAQQRLWFIAQFEKASEAYHIPESVVFEGDLVVESLVRALDSLVVRHEPLRTTFGKDKGSGELVQIIAPAENAYFALVQKDLSKTFSHLDESAQHEILHAEAEAEHSAPFDLSTGPLIRGRLLRLAPDRHLLLVTMHHIVSDEWSMRIAVEEITQLYEAYKAGRENPLAPLNIQYADYAVWQREYFQGEPVEQQLSYWKTHLADAPAVLSLPTDHPRPLEQSYRGAAMDLVIPAELSAQLKALAQSQGLTLHMLGLAAWGSLLSRLSGQNRVVIGTPVANRQRQEVEGLIGFFVNTLALQLDFTGHPHLEAILKQAKGISLQGYAHQDVPFEQVVEALQPERSMSHSPIFQALFNFTQDGNDPESENVLALSEVDTENLNLGSQRIAQFDLTLSLADTPEGMLAVIEYATDLFEAQTIARWSEYFINILKGFVEGQNLKKPIAHLPILSETERHQLVVERNRGAEFRPSYEWIHQAFECHVQLQPDAIALTHQNHQLSYQGLNHQANQLAHYFTDEASLHTKQRGAEEQELIGLFLPRDLDVFVAMLAVMKAGKAYVMLDSTQPLERLVQICRQAGITRVVTKEALWEKSKAAFTKVSNTAPSDEYVNPIRVEAVCLNDTATKAALRAQSSENLDPAQLGLGKAAQTPAFAYFTSGSTGVPKGALNSHAGVMHSMGAMTETLGLKSKDRVLQFAALNFDVVIEEIFPTWFAGGTVVIRDEEGVLPPEQLQHMLQRHGITVCELMASYWSLWVSELRAQGKQPPACLRQIILGSDKVPVSAYEQWQGFGIPIVNVFGLTETGCTSLIYKARGALPKSSGQSFLPNGRVLPNTQVYLLDAARQLVPSGSVGELYIGGASVGLGYLGDEALTAQQFVPDPFSENSRVRLYKTGDYARYLPDGNLEYLGRVDQQVKLRGFRIELGEIETQLQQHEAISQAVVILKEEQLVAYVIPADLVPPVGEDFAAADSVRQDIVSLRTHLESRLPKYMVPGVYVTLQALPLTASGKLDRKALPAPDASALRPNQYEAPVGRAEIALASACQEILKLDQIGRHDNFFSIGGSSLSALKVVNHLRKNGCMLDFTEIYLNETISEIAKRIALEYKVTE